MKYHKNPESSIQAELELDWDFLEHSRTYQSFGIIWNNFSQGEDTHPHKQWKQQLTMNQQQQNHHLRTDNSQSQGDLDGLDVWFETSSTSILRIYKNTKILCGGPLSC